MATVELGQTVLLHINDGTRFFVPITSDFNIKVKKLSFKAHLLVGARFGEVFEVTHKKTIEAVPSGELNPAISFDVGSGQDNRHLVDNSANQGLSHDDIERMKAEGARAEDILGALIENSSTFAGKTAFAQEKYLKKKQAKYLNRFRVVRPHAALICDVLLGQDKTCGLRSDTLSQMLTFGDVRAGGRPLVIDAVSGLLVGSVAERMGGVGLLTAATDFSKVKTPAWAHLGKFNLGAPASGMAPPASADAAARYQIEWTDGSAAASPLEATAAAVAAASSSSSSAAAASARGHSACTPLPSVTGGKYLPAGAAASPAVAATGGAAATAIADAAASATTAAAAPAASATGSGPTKATVAAPPPYAVAGDVAPPLSFGHAALPPLVLVTVSFSQLLGYAAAINDVRADLEAPVEGAAAAAMPMLVASGGGAAAGADASAAASGGKRKRAEDDGAGDDADATSAGPAAKRRATDGGADADEEDADAAGDDNEEAEAAAADEEVADADADDGAADADIDADAGAGGAAGAASAASSGAAGAGTSGGKKGSGKGWATATKKAGKAARAAVIPTKKHELRPFRLSERELQTVCLAGFDSLLVATPHHPLQYVLAAIRFMRFGAPLAVYCQQLQPLVECFRKLKQLQVILHAELHETWYRESQVLPERTHPVMTMHGPSGYLLTAYVMANQYSVVSDDAHVAAGKVAAAYAAARGTEA